MANQDVFDQPRLDSQEKKGGLFKKESKAEGVDFAAMINEINSLSRRVRIMEERYNNLRRKTQVTEQNMLLTHKKVMNEVRMMSEDMIEIKRDIMDVKDKVKLVIKELQSCAKKEDVDTLSKYINLWEPVNFVTRNEVEKLIRDILEENQKI